MSKIIGIDLGTTCSKVSIWDSKRGRPLMIPNLRGDPMTPSVVGLSDAGEVLVGEDAKQNGLFNPAKTVWQIKREMGRDLKVTMGGKDYDPQTISAFILRYLKICAERYLGEPVHDAVITVPGHFTEAQRGATRTAGLIAGLNVHRLVDDATAAAVAYGLKCGLAPGAPKIYAVYDLGGGALDVSIVEMTVEDITILGTAGDSRLGGLDMDEEMVKWTLSQIEAAQGIDLGGDETVRRRLLLEVEGVKKRLAFSETAELIVPFLTMIEGRPFSLKLAVTRPQYERLIEPLLDRSLACLDEAVASSREKGRAGWKELDGALLVGGATRLPRIGDLLRKKFRDKFAESGCPDRPFDIKSDVNPDDLVALGAAIVAAPLIAWGKPPEDVARMSAEQAEQRIARNRAAGQGEMGVPETSAPSPSPAFPPSPAKPLFVDENVQFTVYRPRAIEPAKWSTLLAFAHLSDRPPDAPASAPDPVAEVKKQALQVLGDQMGAYQERTQDSLQAVPREGELTFLPDVAGVEFNPPSRSFLWIEPVHREEFRLRASAGSAGRTLRGRLSVFLGRVLLADVPLVFRVDAAVDAATAPGPVAEAARPYRKIFASYSHRDLRIVEELERYAAVVGDRYLRDWVELRAGEVWSERLQQMIEEADIFQLFWSTASMSSPFVRQEWECALSLGRPGFIRPVYWEDPLPESPDRTLPPAELRRLHFQRLSLTPVEQGAPVSTPGAAEVPGPRFRTPDSSRIRPEERKQEMIEEMAMPRRIDRDGLDREKTANSEQALRGLSEQDRDDRVGALVAGTRAFLGHVEGHPPQSPIELERTADKLREFARGARELRREASPGSRKILDTLMEALDEHLEVIGEALKGCQLRDEFQAILSRLQREPVRSPEALDQLERRLSVIRREAGALPSGVSADLIKALDGALEKIQASWRRPVRSVKASAGGGTLMQVPWVGIVLGIIGLATFVFLLILRKC